jgi:nucleoside-diphosphate-sugar epimerase
MKGPRDLLLTGATGLLGRYLLRDLLAAGHRVAVLARDAGPVRAGERIAGLVAPWRGPLGAPPPDPVVLGGDLLEPGLGLSAADRAWLARHRPAVVHAAADVTLRRSHRSDPWATNADGTRRLLDLCEALGLTELHHVSTAFVCGDRAGPVAEDELEAGQRFHNDYERSKFEAERRLRRARGVRATVYRPSVIVGDSGTGFTSSYHGPYRFLEAAVRLTGPTAGGRRSLPLRLPFAGDEPRDLVPVDWVSRAIVRVVQRPECHGRTYHLTAREPVPVRAIKEVAERVLAVDGVRLAGPGRPADPSPLEELFLDQLREYWPYLHGDPVFDSRNTRAALPDLPPPRIDRAALERLIRFAVADDWGRARRRSGRGRPGVDCSDYLERFFPAAARGSVLGRLPLELTVGLEVRGPGGGRWACRWRGPGPAEVRREPPVGADVVYRMDRPTFESVVRGWESPQAAFFARRIEIAGDLEKALKLAVLFGQFVAECPYRPLPEQEVADAAGVG